MVSDLRTHTEPDATPPGRQPRASSGAPLHAVLDWVWAGEDLVHLRRGGTSLLVRLGDRLLPSVLHWGQDLGDLSGASSRDIISALNMPVIDSVISAQELVSVLPQHSYGWLGRPGLLGSRQGKAWSVAFDDVRHTVEDAGGPDWA